jgi:acyl-CoA hydrolase
VVDDRDLMQRIADGVASQADLARLQHEGEYLHGAFYLGSPDFYQWLRGLSDEERRGIGMKRVGEVNELYGGDEVLERLQRRDARFFNTCMMATALGAAVSDALEDGRVVSGVGGQYNFVAMAHALPDARSVLLLRATREAGGKTTSNVVWNYGHTTIPRHLRDIYISEYGIADVRGRSDEDVVTAMATITDARFQQPLLDTARNAGKLRRDFQLPKRAAANTPEMLREALQPYRRNGNLPDYPLGSDFTGVEQRLVKALGWLKTSTATRAGKLRTLWRALSARTADGEALQRMGLASPATFGERMEARLLNLALARSASQC